jgi:hypothetical protein
LQNEEGIDPIFSSKCKVMQNDIKTFQIFYLFLPLFLATLSMSVSTTERISPASVYNKPVGDSLYITNLDSAIVALVAVKFKPLPKEFFQKAGQAIVNKHFVFTTTMRKTGILASVQAAQYLVEGNAGKSKLASENHNHFGVKFTGNTNVPGYAGKVWRKDSGEGKYCWWYIYKDDESSFAHHARILQGKRYRHLIGIKTYPEYLTGIKKGGYATDPNYAYTLANIIYSRKLFELDYLVFRNYKEEWEHAVTNNKERMESENGGKP